MSIKINYQNKSNGKISSNHVLFTDDKFNINSLKKHLSESEFTYINDLLKDMPNAEKLSSLTKSFYENASHKGMGDLLISELIEKDNN